MAHATETLQDAAEQVELELSVQAAERLRELEEVPEEPINVFNEA